MAASLTRSSARVSPRSVTRVAAISATTSERQGRVIDHDEGASMEKKKREGYF